KGFNNIEMLGKYNFNVSRLKFVLINYTNFVSIQDHSAVVPVFTDKAFVRTWFDDLTLMCKLNTKLMVLANWGMERAWGNKRVNLADANGQEIRDVNNKPVYSPTGRTIDQTGRAWGLGIGYDITPKASIHIRHKWMDQKDKNFTQDVFQGTESTVELKM